MMRRDFSTLHGFNFFPKIFVEIVPRPVVPSLHSPLRKRSLFENSIKPIGGLQLAHVAVLVRFSQTVSDHLWRASAEVNCRDFARPNFKIAGILLTNTGSPPCKTREFCSRSMGPLPDAQNARQSAARNAARSD
jgi:hypothetical protein